MSEEFEIPVWENVIKELNTPIEGATHAEILFYKQNDNACMCQLFTWIMQEDKQIKQVLNKKLYKLDSLPFSLSEDEIASLIEHYDQGEVLTPEQKKQAINRKYKALLKQGCPTSLGFKIDCESNNVNDFSQSLSLLNISGLTEIVVRDYDNINHTVSKEDFTQICLELGSHIMTLRQQKWDEVTTVLEGI